MEEKVPHSRWGVVLGLADMLSKHELPAEKTAVMKCSCGVSVTMESAHEHVSQALMREVERFYRVRPKCHYCSAIATSQDHIVPKSIGGSDLPENIVPACIDCNSKKGNDFPTCTCATCQRAVVAYRTSVENDVRLLLELSSDIRVWARKYQQSGLGNPLWPEVITMIRKKIDGLHTAATEGRSGDPEHRPESGEDGLPGDQAG